MIDPYDLTTDLTLINTHKKCPSTHPYFDSVITQFNTHQTHAIYPGPSPLTIVEDIGIINLIIRPVKHQK